MEVVARQHARMRHPVFMLIGHRYGMGFFLLANALSALAAARYTPRYRYFAVTVFAATLLLTDTNAFWLYYYAICAPFLLFGLVAVLRFPLPSLGRGSMWGVGVVATLVVLMVFAMHLFHGQASWSWQDNAEKRTFDHYVDIMSQVERPRIIYYNTCTAGFGIPVESLPG